MQCTLCGTRPATRARVAEGNPWCHVCATAIADARKRKWQRANWWRGAVRYAVWRGMGVAFMPGDNGTVTPKPLARGVLRQLPKGKVINLDEYCPGFDRDTVKRIKAAIKATNFAEA